MTCLMKRIQAMGNLVGKIQLISFGKKKSVVRVRVWSDEYVV